MYIALDFNIIYSKENHIHMSSSYSKERTVISAPINVENEIVMLYL